MLYFSLGCKTEVVSQAVIMCRESRLSCIYLPNSVTLWCRTLWCYYCCGGTCKVEHLLGPWQLLPPASLCYFPQQHLVHPSHLVQNMTMETAPNFASWTSTQSGIRWLVRNFIRWPLFSTLLRKSACRDAVGIFRSVEMLSEIFFDAPRGLFHWSCGELIVISNKYNFGKLCNAHTWNISL